MNLATDVAIVHLTGGTNLGTDMFGPYLSWVQVELSKTRPEIAMYFSTDGHLPAEETSTQLLTAGTPYTSAFNVTSTTLVRVSTVMWGLGVGQLELPIKIQAEKPVITPASAAAEIMPSPVLVSIDTATPGAVIKYSFSGSMGSAQEQFVYTGPFAINSVSMVTAWTEKEGVLPSTSVSVTYSLKATTPVIAPPPGPYVAEVGVNVSSDTVMANVYVTICNRTEYPGWSNKSTGQIFQTQKDFYCYPDCRGLCVGGYNDKKPCAGTSDLLTCGGGGSCVEEYREVRLCFPHEWPPGRIVWSAPIILNQTRYGTGAWVTSYATREGLADSNITSQQYHIITEVPTLNIMPHVQVTVPWPNANSPTITVPFLEHGQDEGPYPGPLSFNFTNSRPATVYYTLNGVYPTPGAPGTIEVPYSEIQSPLKLNQSANVTWIGLGENLAPSPVQFRTIAVQAVAPELIVDVRFLNKAGGMVDLAYYDVYQTPTADTKRGIVSEGFAYPGIGQVVLTDPNYFADRSGGWPPPPGWPLLAMRTYTQEASIFYRLLNGTNASTELPTWPATSVRKGTTEPNTTQGLLEDGWREYNGLRVFDFSSPSEGIEIRRNYTVEVLAAVPGSTLIPSNVVSYPLFVRERCEQGQASVDGYGPCALCPLDSYMVCHGDFNSPPCVCVRCDNLQNDTGTFEKGSPDVSHCKPFCHPGTYSPQEGIDVLLNNCTKCPLGTYSDKKRTHICTECPVGTATWRHGASSIIDCRGAGGLIAGGFHTCGVDVNGAAKCWGYNGFNQTEVPKKLVRWEENGVPYAEYRDDRWYSVAAGSFHSCGITLDFEAKCWGQEFAGKTTVPTMHLYDSPQMPLQEIVEWTDISASAGYHHSCGIADGRAICWGDDEYRQTQVPQSHYWRSISAGQFHTCGVDDKGKAHCWGDDSYGQSHVPDMPDQVPWRNVSAGHYHSCGVTGLGDMHCWGSTLYEATAFPQQVESWSSVAVGRYHSCGLTAHGDIHCWGSKQDGATTVPDVGDAKWRGVTAGLFHTCGILEDRTGVCWGRSVYGLTILPEAAWSSV